jgi:DNA-binding MarR family transcriptional regulator
LTSGKYFSNTELSAIMNSSAIDQHPTNAGEQRLVDAMEAYARLGHTLRFSPFAQESFWQDLPLTLPQVKALGLIACSGPTGRSGRDLATNLGVGPSAVTGIVDRLVEHGFVSRSEDQLDRRIQRLRPTSKGVEVLQRLASVRRDVLAEIVARIDPEDWPIAERGLTIISRAIERLAAELEPGPHTLTPTAS